MKVKQTQKEFVIDCLVKNGVISRNYCLKNYISRLSAIILDLQHEGWTFITFTGKQKNFKKEHWNNYYYQVISKPERKLI